MLHNDILVNDILNHIYNGGSTEYNGAEFPVKYGRICALEGYFSLMRPIFVGLDNRSPLTHNTSILNAQIPPPSVSH